MLVELKRMLGATDGTRRHAVGALRLFISQIASRDPPTCRQPVAILPEVSRHPAGSTVQTPKLRNSNGLEEEQCDWGSFLLLGGGGSTVWEP